MRLLRVFLAGLAALCTLHSQQTPAPLVTFSDDFHGPGLDLSHWSPHDPFKPEKGQAAVTFSGGAMQLQGAISTIGLFSQLYGRFEVRCRILDLRARLHVLLFPVHFSELPSIDLFQSGTNGQARVFLGNHWGTDRTDRSYGDWFEVPNLSTAMHTFSIDWDKEKIVWAIDGKDKLKSVDGVPDQPMFLEIIADSAIGPALEIASVRVLRKP